MLGLIKKDLLAGYRRTSRFSQVFVIVIDLALILFLRNIYSLITVALLSVPARMSALVTTLKEIDTNSTGEVYTLTLPYSWKDYVRGRFLAGMIDGLKESLFGLVMVILHFILYGLFPFGTYVLLWAAGLLLGLILIFINTVASFFGGINASAVIYMLTIFVLLGGFLLVAFMDFDYRVIFNLPPLFLGVGSVVFCAAFGLASYVASLKAVCRSRKKQ